MEFFFDRIESHTRVLTGHKDFGRIENLYFKARGNLPCQQQPGMR